MIRLIDLPGVAEIEAALKVPGRHLLKEYDDLPERINATSRRLFGITEADTEFVPRPDEIIPLSMYDQLETLTPDGSLRQDAWEENFAFLEYEWEEEDAFWGLAGLDVRGDDGELLDVMEYFGRQLVCLVRGLHPQARLSVTGEDPIPSATGEHAEEAAERWGRKLAEEARRFKARR